MHRSALRASLRTPPRATASPDLSELLRFEQLLSELSASLISLTADQIDDAIGRALENVVQFFQVDRSTLFEVVDDRLVATHGYVMPGVNYVREVGTAEHPWLYASLLRGETQTLASLEELPAEAAPDRASLAAAGVQSLMAIPLAIGGQPRHCFVLAAVRTARVWDPSLVPRVRLIGELLADVLARKRAEEAREERLRFERLLADVSARFVSVAPERVDEEIHEALEQMLHFFDLDRFCFLRFAPEGVIAMHPSHLVRTGTIDFEPPNVDRRTLYPWMVSQALKGKSFVVNRSELPPEAAVDLQSFHRYSMRSAVIIPIIVRGRTEYMLGGETVDKDRQWREDTLIRLRLLGEIFGNVLARRRQEEELREAELKYRTVADSTYDWTYWMEPSGTFRYITPSCARITGYAALDFENRPALLRKLVLPEDQPLWDEHHRQCHEAQQTGELQYRIRAQDGRLVWLEHVCRPVYDEAGQYLGVRASNQDVTKRKQAEAESRRLQNDLAHVGRVAVLGELAAAIAHEINQPLTAILNNAQAAQRLLARPQPDLDEIQEALRDIVEDDRRAGQVIRRLRAMLKREEPERKPLQVNSLLDEVLALIRGELIIRDLQLRFEPALDLPLVLGDRIQLQQVLLNLVRNAGEAMLDTPRTQRQVVIRTRRHAPDAVAISVSDAGPPVPSEVLENLFNPFYTTKSDGLGMGLPISRSIVEAHGGRIFVEPNIPSGLTIHFTLPCSPPHMT